MCFLGSILGPLLFILFNNDIFIGQDIQLILFVYNTAVIQSNITLLCNIAMITA